MQRWPMFVALGALLFIVAPAGAAPDEGVGRFYYLKRYVWIINLRTRRR